MNQHIENAQTYIAASNETKSGLTARQLHIMQAQVEATLALAYEQRTANLIAAHSLMATWDELGKELEKRLGLA